jgi:uridylate kinase
METWVISLGGSRIAPGEVDTEFILKFKKLIEKFPNKKFVVVTGGGKTARNYINALRKIGKKTKTQSKTGIAITRFHAQFLMKIFGKPANDELPLTIKRTKTLLRKNHIVFAGALRYAPKQTSDAVAAKLANELKCEFINLTNVRGLYTSNPKKNKNAKFIKLISWREFHAQANKIKYKSGQNFVLDQTAAKIIKDRKIPTYIVGSLKQIENILKRKAFIGTLVRGSNRKV